MQPDHAVKMIRIYSNQRASFMPGGRRSTHELRLFSSMLFGFPKFNLGGLSKLIVFDEIRMNSKKFCYRKLIRLFMVIRY